MILLINELALYLALANLISKGFIYFNLDDTCRPVSHKWNPCYTLKDLTVVFGLYKSDLKREQLRSNVFRSVSQKYNPS